MLSIDAAKKDIELFDASELATGLQTLADEHAGNERELRTAVARRLKAGLIEGRKTAEALLLKDRHGRRCAERLCRMQDRIIGALYEFAANRLYPQRIHSTAERMAIIATGGY